MNQNRNQNRRRGRGSNRGGQGGGHQSNRIDSRARGNAPQMLEKYKKLAHDASLNGDRVLTEYYLQFADHYFRVVADSRAQKEEGRPPRRDQDREQSFDSDDEETEDREEVAREERPRRHDERNESEVAEQDEGQRGVEGDEIQEATAEDNPFVRDTRRGEARSGQRGRGRGRAASANAGAKEEEAAESTFDPGVLPPSIAREEDAPRPRTRTRRARPADDAGDEALEAVS